MNTLDMKKMINSFERLIAKEQNELKTLIAKGAEYEEKNIHNGLLKSIYNEVELLTSKIKSLKVEKARLEQELVVAEKEEEAVKTVKVIRVEKTNCCLGIIEYFDFKDSEKANSFALNIPDTFHVEVYDWEEDADEYRRTLESPISNKPVICY